MAVDLPDGWERVEGATYTKFVRRDAVTVPKRHAEGSAFDRDAVILVTDTTTGVVKGPGARTAWSTDTPEALGARLAAVVNEWIADGGEPYGGSDLHDRLAREHEDVTDD